MIDAIEAFWIKNKYNETKDTLILNADNGPENNSRRKQFMFMTIHEFLHACFIPNVFKSDRIYWGII